MRNQRGFTFMELLIVMVLLAAIAAVAIPALARIRVTSVTKPFKAHFGVDLYEYGARKADQPPSTWLDTDQKRLLRPLVNDRLPVLCDQRPVPLYPSVRDLPPTIDSFEVQNRLARLDAERNGAPPSTAEACKAATAVATKLDLSPLAEKQ